MHLLACSRPAPDFTFHLVSQVGLEPFPAPAPVPPPVTDERKKEILAGEQRLSTEPVVEQLLPALQASTAALHLQPDRRSVGRAVSCPAGHCKGGIGVVFSAGRHRRAGSTDAAGQHTSSLRCRPPPRLAADVRVIKSVQAGRGGRVRDEKESAEVRQPA